VDNSKWPRLKVEKNHLRISDFSGRLNRGRGFLPNSTPADFFEKLAVNEKSLLFKLYHTDTQKTTNSQNK